LAKVELRGITKIFNGTVAVRKTDLEICDGEFMVLVGPSGCGKTTTLRMVAGLEMPSDGMILIGEKDVTYAEPKNRDIAMVFQSYALYPHMTVYENMAFHLKIKKMDKKEIDERVQNAAALLGLSNYLARYPKQLSGGQRQRVALGRAIVRQPQVFLMDEPLSNLDAKLRVQTRAELIKLHQKLKTTFIYVTHDQTEAMTMGTRIVVMKDGKIQQVGTPAEIYNHPANLFVATFIGSPAMNLLEGTLTRETDHLLRFCGNGISVQFPNTDLKIDNNSKVLLGIRPENMNIYPVENNPNFNDSCLRCMVEVVEHIGSEAILHTRTEHQEYMIIKIPGHAKIPAVGAQIQAQIFYGKTHLFDADSGNKLCTRSYGAVENC